MRWALILGVRFYQRFLRGVFNKTCIYTPTCSEYAIQALEKYGTVLGVRYTVLRIKRCNGALYRGGEDHP